MLGADARAHIAKGARSNGSSVTMLGQVVVSVNGWVYKHRRVSGELIWMVIVSRSSRLDARVGSDACRPVLFGRSLVGHGGVNKTVHSSI